jgi:hypothetical protein
MITWAIQNAANIFYKIPNLWQNKEFFFDNFLFFFNNYLFLTLY